MPLDLWKYVNKCFSDGYASLKSESVHLLKCSMNNDLDIYICTHTYMWMDVYE